MARKPDLRLAVDNDSVETGLINVNGFTDAADAASYVTAGNATITLESRRTGNHFTYKVSRAKDDNGEPSNRWFVGVLSGPDNDSDYSYIGLIETKLNGCLFRQTAKARFKADAPCVRGFVYFWNHVERGHLPTDMIVRHSGTCGRCGRTLTVPSSVTAGIGPECSKKMEE
jgi:hypothetical protein